MRWRCFAWVPGVLLIGAVLYWMIYLRFRLEAKPILTAETQTEVILFLRAALEGRPLPRLGLSTQKTLAGPLWLTIYRQQTRLLRYQANQRSLPAALREVAQTIARSPACTALSVAARHEARIKVDLLLATGPIITAIPLVFANSVVPGLDGLGLTIGETTAYLLPDDFFQHNLFAGYQPFYFVPEFRSGLHLKSAINLLGDQLALSGEQWRRLPKTYFRWRAQSFVESPDHERGLTVQRSRVPVDHLNHQRVQQSVIRAADYVLRQIKDSGEFEYIYHPLQGTHEFTLNYSLPRHAGTTWFLALAYRVLRLPRLQEGARRAIEYLTAHAVPPACQSTPRACIGTNSSASLGSAALSLVAIVEYQQATGDHRFLALARRLGQFILWMQKSNGDFCHRYTPSTGKRHCEERLLYYSGEAALALAKLHQLTQEATLIPPLERALDFLTDEKYDFFLGKFFISEDHWTCIAAEAAFDAVNKDQYAQFCYEFVAFGQRAQIQAGEGLMHDLRGAFALTPFFLPQNCATGSRTEANIATYLLSLKRHEPQPEILTTTLAGIRFLVDQQIRPESGYLFPQPAEASGGMMQTTMMDTVRIDFVQHAAAALARGLQLVP